MIQTIVLIENGKYPFGEVVLGKKSIKVEDIRSYKTLQQLRQQKSKMQNLFNSWDKSSQTTVSFCQNLNFIRLTKIYQQDLTLHFIYEYIPYSLNQYIKHKLIPENDLEKSQIMQMNSKLFLKKVCYELGAIINFLIKRKIKATLQYDLLGIDQQQNLKFFIDAGCQILFPEVKSKEDKSLSFQSHQAQTQLKEFYESKKQTILFRLEAEFRKMKKRQQNVPNFVIKGNQLVFSKPFVEVQSQCYSPCPSNFTESSFTDRCESVQNMYATMKQGESIRRTHGNLFTKMKKTESQNYNTQSNKKLQQNLVKLENLRKKSKKLNEELKQSYLSNSQCFPANTARKQQGSFNRRGSTQFQNTFGKRVQTEVEDDQWRASQIPQKLRKTHLPKGSQPKSPNRFGFNLDGKRSKSNRNHKSSFQFKPNKKQRDWFNPNKSFEKGLKDDIPESYQQSRSIRIEVQQKTNKQRKNSFKVKILTCQQMEMDGENVEQFVFNAMNRNFNQQKNQTENGGYSSDQSDYAKQSSRSHTSKYSQRFQTAFSDKFKKQEREEDVNTKFSQSPIKQHIRQKERETSSQKNIFEKYYEQFGKDKQKSSKNPQLQEKIKLAKQKAENVLNKYMKTKKYSSKNSASKYVV